ncbi:MAG: hypothetical protein WC451_05765 [Patescibacteria group bacterium]|jgi:hypothetical protein
MIIKDLAKEDVDRVFDNLWPQGREEILIMGSTVEKERQKFKNMAGKPWAVSFHDSECFAVFIMEQVGEMKWRTSFASIEEGFKKNWMALTRYFRKSSDVIIYDVTKGEGIIELFTISDTDYNWFQTIGFELIGTDGFIDQYEKKAR